MTCGEGGMITTDDEALADRAASFVNHGRSEGYEHVRLGHNFRMTSVAAALGRVQLERLPEYNEQRRKNASQLTEGLYGASIQVPSEPDDKKHVYHQYTIRHEQRDGLKQHLKDHDVGTAVYYPRCLHEQPVYDHIDHSAPIAENAVDEVLSLPVHPGVSRDEIDKILDAVRSYEGVVRK